MIIIVEGIDRVGKTTLCEMIEEYYADVMNIRRFKDDTRYVHNYLNEEVNTEKNNTIMNMIEQGVIENIILDRFHMTEFVYGLVERAYKNDNMYDIDRRLADIDKPDTSIDSEDDIDPGMSYDGHIHNDVVLIYIVPVDIKKSSAKHGYNLERHLKWYNEFYDNTLIKNKIKVDYETLGLALDFIDEILGIKGEDEPGASDKPVEPSEEEVIVHTISKTVEGDTEGSTLENIIKNSSFFNNRAK